MATYSWPGIGITTAALPPNLCTLIIELLARYMN